MNVDVADETLNKEESEPAQDGKKESPTVQPVKNIKEFEEYLLDIGLRF